MTKTMLKTTFEDVAPSVGKLLPKDAVIRHVGEQRGQLTIWFETDFDLMDRDDGESTELRHFIIRRTGDPIPEEFGTTYLGTVPMASVVWHVFEQVSK